MYIEISSKFIKTLHTLNSTKQNTQFSETKASENNSL